MNYKRKTAKLIYQDFNNKYMDVYTLDKNDEYEHLSINNLEQLPPDCCQVAKSKTLRKLGLFKLENKTTGQISLNSKTYCLYNIENETTLKVSHKGVSVALNNLTYDKFLNVLNTKITYKGINKGFRDIHKHMATYTQEKDALTWLYVKRKLNDDYNTTMPLDI